MFFIPQNKFRRNILVINFYDVPRVMTKSSTKLF